MVKEALPSILALPGSHLRYEKPEEIARGYAAKGISVAAARAINGQVLQAVNRQFVMLFDWVEGREAEQRSDPYASQVMGRLLGRMHTDPPNVEGCPEEPLFDPNWRELAEQSKVAKLPFSADLEKRLDLLDEWTAAGELARIRLLTRRIASHRDLTRDNVLWVNAEEPVLIDWEGAGQMNPGFETYATAYGWATNAKDELDALAFEAFFDGYRTAGGIITESHGTLLDARVREEVRWLYWCLLRPLRVEVVDAAAEQKAIDEISRIFQRLDTMHRNREQYLELAERVMYR